MHNKHTKKKHTVPFPLDASAFSRPSQHIHPGPKDKPSLTLSKPPPQPSLHHLTPILALDCEIVRAPLHPSHPSGPQRQLLGRVTLVNYYGAPVYDTHVYHPGITLTSTNYPWSGIRYSDLRPRNGATAYADAREIVKGLVRGRRVVGHDVGGDWKVLGFGEGELRGLGVGVRDTQRYTGFGDGVGRGR